MSLLTSLTAPSQTEPDSGIVRLAMYGFNKPGIIPLWSGEGNLPTPALFSDPVKMSLERGETFYTYQRGLPELREALVRYHHRHFGSTKLTVDHISVTGGGMQAIQTAFQIIAGKGDEIIIPSPAWPNYAGPLRLQGSRPIEVPMHLRDNRWMLDIEAMAQAISPRTKAIVINSPSNPLGWTASLQELIELRDLCRKHGLWILGDEVYNRFYYAEGSEARAPSFLDICDPDEKLILVNTFSKNWAMTGWRVGWMQAPAELGPVIERVIQYNTSGTAAFLQRGCIAALDLGDEFVSSEVARARDNRDLLISALGQNSRVRFHSPDGAFYLFFAIDGMSDSFATAMRIVDEANVGLAPGGGFGTVGEGYLRLCFLKDRAKLEQAVDRLTAWLRTT